MLKEVFKRTLILIRKVCNQKIISSVIVWWVLFIFTRIEKKIRKILNDKFVSYEILVSSSLRPCVRLFHIRMATRLTGFILDIRYYPISLTP